MKDYERFIFDSYSFDRESRKIELKYGLDDDILFTETIELPEGIQDEIDEEALDRALFNLHLIGGVSYYKTCIPKKMEILSGTLTKKQAEFWNTVYENGLGEFFYRNEIDYRGLIDFPAEEKKSPKLKKGKDTNRRILVPIGGGKDSVVTIELFKRLGHNCTLFRMGDHPLINKAAKVSGLPCITVKRKLSGELFDLNEGGALNGHIPISAYLSWLSVVSSILYGFNAIAMSNEKSANEGNTEYLGKVINHQWSKSLEFEKLFQEYLSNFVTKDIDYFSALRPLTELQIVKLYSLFPQYFPCTTSCNKNWRIVEEKPKQRWCCECPKCAFAFSILSAFLSKEILMDMFGKNLFEEENLTDTFNQLLGISGVKPFECVGTKEETTAAFILAYQRGDMNDTIIMEYFSRKVLPSIDNQEKIINDSLNPSDEHAIPPDY